ncbi:formin-A [Biomphalaria glabrata]|nr:formin-A [Biomphalaria glabrata]
MSHQICGKVHNFGIYRKGGKRCILQLDFPGRMLLVIQKGHIKKSHNFHTLEHYDSEEGLHVSLKFKDSEFEFETDNSEEKYTICRLLGYVLQLGHGEDDESIDSGQGLSSIIDQPIERAEVIKEGLLEKKGNTAITLWNKRRVKLTPGEFSYYKPGEELALNIVQLWQDHTKLKKHGQNGFSVTVRDRVYHFRVLSEYKVLHMTEIVRNEWFVAFEKALNHIPASSKLFDIQHNVTLNEQVEDSDEHIYDVTPDISPHLIASSRQSTKEVLDEKIYADKALPLPPKRSLHQSLDNLLFHHKDNKGSSSHYNSPSSVHSDISTQSSSSEDHIEVDKLFPGSAAELRAKLARKGGKSSSLKAYRAQQDFYRLQLEENTLSSTKLKAFHISSNENDVMRHVGPSPLSVSCDNLSTPSSSKTRIPNLPPPPPPPLHQGGTIPLPPLGGPPPPPPLMKDRMSMKQLHSPHVKLKQVHWVKVNSNQISDSIWKEAHDLTQKLDLSLLEEQFAIQEKKPVTVKTKPKEEKVMLVDAKRAQNLGILFCGLKLDNLTKLTEALHSITEVDTFPSDKIATLKRYQPNTEDKEMYKLYLNKSENLHPADRFMLELCEIPQLSIRLDLLLILWEFPNQFKSLEEEVNDLLMSCEEILSCSSLVTALEYLLAIGNYMNSMWNTKQLAQGFQLSSIEKILSVKSQDNKSTLCNYLVKQLKVNDPEVLDWPKLLPHVPKCTEYSMKAVGAEIDVMKNDLQKIKKTLKILRNNNSENKNDKKFIADVQTFIAEHDRNMEHLEARYHKVSEKYKQILIKFGESPKTQESMFTFISHFMDKFQQAL